MLSRLSFSSKLFLFILLFVLLTTQFSILNTGAVYARDCNKPTDFTFGNLVSAFIDPDSDCSMDYFNDPGSPVFRDWLKYSEVSCIRDPMLNAQTIGDWEKALADGQLDEFQEESGGDAHTGLQPMVPNIGLNPKVVEKDLADSSLSPALSSITTSYDQFNVGQVEAGMRSKGEMTREQYMKQFPECAFTNPDGSVFINDFCEGNARYKSEEDLYQEMKLQKDKDVKCATGNPEPQWHCQNSYNIGKVTTNVDILKGQFPKTVEEYKESGPLEKNKFTASTQRNKARTMLCVALVPNISRTYEYTGNDGEYWYYNLSGTKTDQFKSKEVKIACGDVQGLVGTIDGLEQEYRVYNPPEVTPGTSVAKEIQIIKDLSKTPGEDHMDWPPPPKDSKYPARDRAIWQKLRTVGSSCRGPQDNYKQFSGGNTDTKTMGDPNWLFRLLGLHPRQTAEEGDAINPYSIYFLAPGDFTVLEHMTGRNAYSPYRAYLTLQESQVLDDKENNVDIPWFLTQDEGSDGSRKVGWWPEPEEKYNPKTEKTETVIVQKPVRQKYAGGGQVAMHQRGGQQAQNFLELTFQKLKPLDDPERIDECNLYGGLLRKIADLPGILGLAGGVADSISKTFDDCRPNVESLASVKPNVPSNLGAICDVAKAYNLDCDFFKAIYAIESCSGTYLPTTKDKCCNSAGFCGPMAVGAGIVDTISKDKKRDVCMTEDKGMDNFELAARWMLIKKWCNYNSGVCLGSPNPYEWKESYIQKWGDSSIKTKEEVQSFVLGWYGSTTQIETRAGWPVGSTYVDAVMEYLKTGSLWGDCGYNAP